MALWDTADLLRRCKNLARRPATDQAVGDAKWYDWLTEAQAEVYPDVFSRFPDFGYSSPIQLTSADNGLTYTFGLDAAGDPIRPWGHAELYAALTSIPDDPLRLGIDFIFDGASIRFAHGRTRTFSLGPYARFVADPDIPIDATHAPLLQPKTARMLLVYKALEQWASRPGSGALPSYYESKYDKYLDKIIMKLATAYNAQGGRAIEGDVRKWWYSGDFATADQGAEGAQQFDSNQFS